MQVLHSTITNFLEQVCLEVKYKKAHRKIEAELSSHIYELIDLYIDKGMTEIEAAKKAIEQMGNATDIGKDLHKVNKPKIEWSLITLISITVLIGLVSLFSIARDPAFRNLNLSQFIKSYSIYGSLGILLFIGCFFFDYTKLEKYSLHIFIGSLVLLLISALSHNTINGLSTIWIGPFRFTPISYVVPSLIVSFSGLVNKWGKGDIRGAIKLYGLAALAIILCILQPSWAKAMILASGLLVLITKAVVSKGFIGNKKVYLSIIYGGGLISSLFMLITATDYQLMRMNVFKYRLDPMGSGYAYHMSRVVKEGARLFGRGEGLYVSDGINDVFGLPEANTDFILSYIVSAFGWIIGIALIVTLTLLIVRMFMSIRKIQSTYGQYLSSAIITVFTIQILINVLMNFGLFPYVGIGLPLVSYGGANFVSSMTLLGLFLGIYRRKDILGVEVI